MLRDRQSGAYVSQSLSVTDPPLNFIQNGGFEKVNRNSDKNRSRWLWWGGWSWGGDYENMWEDRPAFVHSGQFSARIRCTGATGRIGISTPPLPAIPGATEYKLTFWAKGEGDNMLFVNFEQGAQRHPAGEDRRRVEAIHRLRQAGRGPEDLSSLLLRHWRGHDLAGRRCAGARRRQAG